MAGLARRRDHAMRAFVAPTCVVAGVVTWAACSEPDKNPPLPQSQHGSGGAGGGFDAGNNSDGPPALDAQGLCGNQLHELVIDAPNVYFVLDASGSMGTLDGEDTRYEKVRIASVDLVRGLGPLINVGAALFPRFATETNPCHVGGQVFPVTQGTPHDPASATNSPTTEAFRLAIGGLPKGGTPTSATLETITPALASLEGKTIVLLATDGAPNCNPDASCTAAECMVNIEGGCDGNVNCCDPSGPYGPDATLNCVDRAASVAAVEAIAALGIDVYVVGIPGSEIYADVLDEMAVAAGTAQIGPPSYYQVQDLDVLAGVLGDIASVYVSCEFELADAPAEPGFTNVYLDKVNLAQSPIDGWIWKDEKTIVLVGEACERVKKGQVGQVQIVSGCPTEVAK